MVDLAQYLVGGAANRQDSISGLSPDFQSALTQMFASAPADIQQNLRINSAYRSPELQERLWQDALAKYGDPEIADNWVAPPGRSNHNHGMAVDLKYLSPEATQWAHQNAGQYGLDFPLSNEDWHIELASARGGQGAPAQQGPASAPGAAAQPSGGSPLAASFAGGQPQTGGLSGDPGGVFGNVALAFMQNQQQANAQREEEERADQERRRALFGGLSSMYG